MIVNYLGPVIERQLHDTPIVSQYEILFLECGILFSPSTFLVNTKYFHFYMCYLNMVPIDCWIIQTIFSKYDRQPCSFWKAVVSYLALSHAYYSYQYFPFGGLMNIEIIVCIPLPFFLSFWTILYLILGINSVEE